MQPIPQYGSGRRLLAPLPPALAQGGGSRAADLGAACQHMRRTLSWACSSSSLGKAHPLDLSRTTRSLWGGKGLLLWHRACNSGCVGGLGTSLFSLSVLPGLCPSVPLSVGTAPPWVSGSHFLMGIFLGVFYHSSELLQIDLKLLWGFCVCVEFCALHCWKMTKQLVQLWSSLLVPDHPAPAAL